MPGVGVLSVPVGVRIVTLVVLLRRSENAPVNNRKCLRILKSEVVEVQSKPPAERQLYFVTPGTRHFTPTGGRGWWIWVLGGAGLGYDMFQSCLSLLPSS